MTSGSHNYDKALLDAVDSGDVNRVADLLGRGFYTEVRGTKNETPLCVAAFKGNYPIAKLLISRNADVNVRDDDGRTPLHYAALNSELEEGAKIDAEDNNTKLADLF